MEMRKGNLQISFFSLSVMSISMQNKYVCWGVWKLSLYQKNALISTYMLIMNCLTCCGVAVGHMVRTRAATPDWEMQALQKISYKFVSAWRERRGESADLMSNKCLLREHVSVCVRARACVCVRARVCACVRACVCKPSHAHKQNTLKLPVQYLILYFGLFEKNTLVEGWKWDWKPKIEKEISEGGTVRRMVKKIAIRTINLYQEN